jgi:hypothetical protein
MVAEVNGDNIKKLSSHVKEKTQLRYKDQLVNGDREVMAAFLRIVRHPQIYSLGKIQNY